VTSPSAAPEAFAVHAIHFASREGLRGQHFLGHDDRSAEPHPTAYYVWLAVSGRRVVLVDAGLDPDRHVPMPGLAFHGSPVDGLAALGVAPADVTDVVLTHLHHDHTGTVARFPRARYVVQRAEADYWTGPVAARIRREHWLCAEPDVRHVLGSDRLALVDGDRELAPGLGVHRVGGHTAGMQVVRVHTVAGWVVLASDAVHFTQNLADDRPAPILHAMPDVYAAFDRVRELADAPELVVPGHDPEVTRRFPAVPGTRAHRIA
jgi:glyoxylase-like metal-dependent hydrolase (beta-lactamase superfamily II)